MNHHPLDIGPDALGLLVGRTRLDPDLTCSRGGREAVRSCENPAIGNKRAATKGRFLLYLDEQRHLPKMVFERNQCAANMRPPGLIRSGALRVKDV